MTIFEKVIFVIVVDPHRGCKASALFVSFIKQWSKVTSEMLAFAFSSKTATFINQLSILFRDTFRAAEVEARVQLKT